MDEIAKEIQKTNIGIEIPGSNTKIGCLLWMDDVLLMADNEKDLQTLLNITVNTANKYHILFGEEKSKIMIMTSKQELKNTMKLGNMTLKTTENYKHSLQPKMRIIDIRHRRLVRFRKLHGVLFKLIIKFTLQIGRYRLLMEQVLLTLFVCIPILILSLPHCIYILIINIYILILDTCDGFRD